MAKRIRFRSCLSVPEQHELKIALANAKMPPQMAAVLGGPSPEEARRIVKELQAKARRCKRR